MHTKHPEEIVQKQLEAYNARDIVTFMTAWSDEAQFYEFPETLLANGAEEIRARHLVRFKEPNLHGKLLKRMSVGNIVVDQERVTRMFPEGPGQVDVIAMYEVSGNKITRAWFKIGAPVIGDPNSVQS